MRGHEQMHQHVGLGNVGDAVVVADDSKNHLKSNESNGCLMDVRMVVHGAYLEGQVLDLRVLGVVEESKDEFEVIATEHLNA